MTTKKKRYSVRKTPVLTPDKMFKNLWVDTTSKDKLELTPLQAEIIYLLNSEGLTQSQIAIRRGTSRQAINHIIKDLKQKDIGIKPCQPSPPQVNIVSTSAEGTNIQNPTPNLDTKKWRFHALHFVITPYYFYPRYEKIRTEKGNWGIGWREWTIKLNPGMVEIQLKPQHDFADGNKWLAIEKAQNSLNKAMFELGNRFGFEVWKEGKANIRLVNQHFAQSPSELGKASKGFIQVRGYDNKVYFQVDKSKGWEHEYVHADRALMDSEKIEPYLNDMLYSQPPTMSQLSGLMGELTQTHLKTVEMLHETATGLKIIVDLLRPRSEPMQSEQVRQPTPDYIG
jgi:predicted DNA-binding protein (UPF0251 family)